MACSVTLAPGLMTSSQSYGCSTCGHRSAILSFLLPTRLLIKDTLFFADSSDTHRLCIAVGFREKLQSSPDLSHPILPSNSFRSE